MVFVILSLVCGDLWDIARMATAVIVIASSNDKDNNRYII